MLGLKIKNKQSENTLREGIALKIFHYISPTGYFQLVKLVQLDLMIHNLYHIMGKCKILQEQ